jgi:hypothetical protein
MDHRSQPLDSRASWWLVLFLLVTVAVVAVLGALAVHQACFHPPPPVDLPDPRTPRGRYCKVVLPSDPWISFPAGAVVLAGLFVIVTRHRWPWALVALAALICTAFAVNAIIVNELVSAQTI